MLADAILHAAEYHELLPQVGDGTTVYQVEYRSFATQLGTLPPEANTLIRMFDGHRTLEQAIAQAEVPDLVAMKLVKTLLDANVLEIVQRLQSEPVDDFDRLGAEDTNPRGPDRREQLDAWLSGRTPEQVDKQQSDARRLELEKERIREEERRQIEADRRRSDDAAAQLEAARRAAEEAERLAAEARRRADEEAQRRAEEAARREAEAEARRRAEEDAKRKAEEEARRKAEEEARRKAEEEAKRKAEEEARRKAEEEAKQKAEEEAKRKAEEEARRKAEERARKEEEERRRIEEEARRLREEEERRRAKELERIQLEEERLAEMQRQELEDAERRAKELREQAERLANELRREANQRAGHFAEQAEELARRRLHLSGQVDAVEEADDEPTSTDKMIAAESTEPADRKPGSGTLVMGAVGADSRTTREIEPAEEADDGEPRRSTDVAIPALKLDSQEAQPVSSVDSHDERGESTLG